MSHRDPTPKAASSIPATLADPPSTPPIGPDPEQALERLRQRVEPPAARSTPPAPDPTPDRNLEVTRRAVYVVGAMLIVTLAAVGIIGFRGESNAGDIADLAATGEVAANRQRATAEVIGSPAQSCAPALAESVTVECANRERARVGLAPVEVPDGASPSQAAALLGEARADLRLAQRERAGGGRDGVSSPDPGRFRGSGG